MRTPVLSLALGFASTVLLAQSVDVPLTNWTVPPYRGSVSAQGGLTTMADVTPGIAFVGIQPCRVADTRGNGAPIQGGIFANSAQRTWDLTGICGIPAGTDAISANFTVVAATGIPAGSFLLAWPTGQSPPPTAIMTYGPGQIISNAAIVPLGPGEQLNVNVSGSTHIVMDVNGYFTDQYNPGVSFHAVSSTAPAIIGENTGTGYGVYGTSASGYGVVAATGGTASNAAVYATNTSTGAGASGVYGQHTGSGNGVYGTSATGYGVYGTSASGFGVVATTGGTGPNSAVWSRNTSSTNGSSGVFGWANAATGNIFGGKFQTDSTTYSGAAGVKGISPFGDPLGESGFQLCGNCFPVGVLGVDNSTSSGGGGVMGISRRFAVVGNLLGNSGTQTSAIGYIGRNSNGVPYAGWFVGDVAVFGTLSATSKPFIQPHPYDPSKEIKYISLEGPQSEVYFRGTAQISEGITRIVIPDHFRFVADPATYSTLVTPVGAMATVAILSEGDDGIVVQASRNVRIHYVVYAERSAIKNPDPVVENIHFRPDSEGDLVAHLPESYRRMMIQNGTLHEDGTVNMDTARRLGWDQESEKQGRPAPE